MKKKISFLLICVILINISYFPCSAKATSSGREIVRIAYVEDSPFLSRKYNTYLGYAVDYLHEISRYTNWKYEYIHCSWDDAQDKLNSGEVDFILNAQKNKERQKDFLFSKNAFIKNSSTIHVLKDADICYEEYDALTSLTYGFIKGTVQIDHFEAYAKKHQIDYRKKIYDTTESMSAALYRGEIDALVDDALTLYPKMKTVAAFAQDYGYALCGKQNRQLMEELDDAMSQILSQNPSYTATLYATYFSGVTSSSEPLFTRAEKNYIYSCGPIKVGLFTDQVPYCYTDSNGDFQGLIPYVLSEISKKSGIYFELCAVDSSFSPEQFQASSLPLLGSLGLSQAILQNPDFKHTDSILSLNSVAVMKKENKINNSPDAKIVLPRSYYYKIDFFQTFYPAMHVEILDSVEDCLNAVNNSLADAAILDYYTAGYYLDRPRYRNLTLHSERSINESSILIGNKNTDPLLISIINKSIKQLSTNSMTRAAQRILYNTKYQPTFQDKLEENFPSLAFTFILAMFICFFIYYSTKRRILIEAALHEKELFKRKSETDTLTGLYNAETFFAVTAQTIQLAPPGTYVLATIDIEHFKIFNDIYGYNEGDKLLQFIGLILKDITTRYHGICSRLDGDRFACVLPANIDLEKDFAEDFQNRLNDYPLTNQITGCIGIYHINDLSFPVYMMCDCARLASENVRGHYKTHVATYSAKQHSLFLQEHGIVSTMVYALEHGQFHIYIQPKNNLLTGKVTGGEVLVRWIHPEKGMIPPSNFIPIFEKNGFTTKLNLYVIKETCKTLKRWKEEGKSILPVSVNISKLDFYIPSLADEICNLCDTYGIDHKYLQLELTEGAYADDPDFINRQLLTLQKYGFKILMDDFGTEYSSLSMLKNSPVDILKLDIHFLSKADSYNRGNKIISSVVNLATDLGMELIAEGLETAEQANFLRSIHCEQAQGFYFSKPLPVLEFEKYVEKNS